MRVLQRILLVEDDPDIQSVAQLALEAVGGYTVQVCSDGSQALERGDTFVPDLLILDVMMPEMDGLTLFQELRKRPATAQTPIIFMTAKAQAHDIAAYLEMGALGVIAKPFDPMTLPQTVASLWSRVD